MKSDNNNKITPRKFLQLEAFFDEQTNTVSYLVWDSKSLEAAVFDPVFDFDIVSGSIDSVSADKILKVAHEKTLDIKYIIETHAHADHLSGAPYLKAKTKADIGIGANITAVQNIFRPMFNQSNNPKGGDFDLLLNDASDLRLGEMSLEIFSTPGHTPACISIKIEDSIWVGDTMFMPDFGTARCDFPGGNAQHLYQSIQTILSHPDETVLYMCHDYLSGGRKEYLWETSVKEQRETNIHLKGGVSEARFVETRNARDAQLKAPKLLLPSIQLNINAGNLPEAEDNGVSYIKIPIKM